MREMKFMIVRRTVEIIDIYNNTTMIISSDVIDWILWMEGFSIYNGFNVCDSFAWRRRGF